MLIEAVPPTLHLRRLGLDVRNDKWVLTGYEFFASHFFNMQSCNVERIDSSVSERSAKRDEMK